MSKYKIGERAKCDGKLVEIVKIKGVSNNYYIYSLGPTNYECRNDYIACWVADINNFGLKLCFGVDEHELTPLNSTKIRERLGVK